MTESDIKKFMEYDDVVSPVFDGLLQSISMDDLEKFNDLEDDFIGVRLYKLLDTFSTLYKEKCEERNVTSEEISAITLVDVVPYCPALIAARVFDELSSCIAYFAEQFGEYEEQVLENFGHIDGLAEVIKSFDKDHELLPLLTLYHNIITIVDKIIWQTYSWGQMVIDRQWQELADILNKYVDCLNLAHITDGLQHFSADDIKPFPDSEGPTMDPTNIEYYEPF